MCSEKEKERERARQRQRQRGERESRRRAAHDLAVEDAGVVVFVCLQNRERVLRTHLKPGLVFKAHRLLYHSTLGVRVIKKKRNQTQGHEPPLLLLALSSLSLSCLSPLSLSRSLALARALSLSLAADLAVWT